ncbi:unnamed protein product [Caenorhabditis angaria]|uniref:Rab-GAP TBC domain-containing protein n=1 Tax=Caenorhabditis angaria TaxID=860376 RepID=A0A9P1IIJ8_9PELO|nr:unnamed protein product [Caenorhabditis angaria]
MQIFRHSSADTWKKKPLERRSATDRRPSVVDWITGFSDNNNSNSDWIPRNEDERLTRNGSVCAVEESQPNVSTQHKDLLISQLKKEVKVIMEEAVTKKMMDLNSPYVTSLCVAIDACLMDGLRRRLLGLFSCRSSLALIQILAKQNATAETILIKTYEFEGQTNIGPHLVWIREALHLRSLSTIIHHISTAKNIQRLYDKNSLMLDRAKGGMVAALLLGPCAVTFRRMASEEATAEELVERGGGINCGSYNSTKNRYQNGGVGSGDSTTRPPLSITRQGSSIVSSLDRNGSVSRDYVYSLHHNFKTSLLFGKNNVSVATDNNDQAKGYLSLHKNYDGNLTLKWIPNQLMHASSQPSSAHSNNGEFSNLWKNAIQIDMSEIIYIHLHQKDETSPACLTFVNCEGVQSAPLHLPAGQHTIAFLSSLEAGLAPILRLDPPLWIGSTKEKMLPRLRKRSTAVSASSAMLDYVFRLVRTSGAEPSIPPPNLNSQREIEEEEGDEEGEENGVGYKKGYNVSEMHDRCISLPNSPYIIDNVDSVVNFQIGKACQSMRNQILARAFYGWLSYVRHLRTIRQHLLHLVNTTKENGDESEYEVVDEKFWKECRSNPTAESETEFLRRVYYCGIESKELRRFAWPYLMGLYTWNEQNCEQRLEEYTRRYLNDIEEWRVLETEVRRRDEEAFIAARAKKTATPLREGSIINEVFEDEPTCSHRDDHEHLVVSFMANLHRIDKDVERCDRNLIFFSNKDNLESLRRVMCTYVRRNLEEGYIQGMCDLLAPLLVVFEDEALTLECFTILMARLRENFPQRSGMDKCLSNLRSLIQVVDPQIFQMLTASSDFTHLYFSYRWFLLDFKRELSYECTYKVWETIWSATRLEITENFALFFALALVTNYRDVIVTNNMDFTDMIKFFNEMAERHDCSRILTSSRNHVKCLQNLVQNLK